MQGEGRNEADNYCKLTEGMMEIEKLYHKLNHKGKE